MNQLVINSYDEFATYLGKNLGASEWLEVSQERINMFADATLDHQWIHVDVERAKAESPYKSTIAHGYLTLSLLPKMWNEIMELTPLKRWMSVEETADWAYFITAVNKFCTGQNILIDGLEAGNAHFVWPNP